MECLKTNDDTSSFNQVKNNLFDLQGIENAEMTQLSLSAVAELAGFEALKARTNYMSVNQP